MIDNLNNDKNIFNLKINKFFICGDFNTNPDSQCVKILINKGFKSVFNLEKTDNYTMVIDTMNEGIKKLKFDYIFTTNNINILNSYLPLNYLDFNKGIPNEDFPSDHIFLQTDFNFINKK